MLETRTDEAERADFHPDMALERKAGRSAIGPRELPAAMALTDAGHGIVGSIADAVVGADDEPGLAGDPVDRTVLDEDRGDVAAIAPMNPPIVDGPGDASGLADGQAMAVGRQGGDGQDRPLGPEPPDGAASSALMGTLGALEHQGADAGDDRSLSPAGRHPMTSGEDRGAPAQDEAALHAQGGPSLPADMGSSALHAPASGSTGSDAAAIADQGGMADSGDARMTGRIGTALGETEAKLGDASPGRETRAAEPPVSEPAPDPHQRPADGSGLSEDGGQPSPSVLDGLDAPGMGEVLSGSEESGLSPVVDGIGPDLSGADAERGGLGASGGDPVQGMAAASDGQDSTAEPQVDGPEAPIKGEGASHARAGDDGQAAALDADGLGPDGSFLADGDPQGVPPLNGADASATGDAVLDAGLSGEDPSAVLDGDRLPRDLVEPLTALPEAGGDADELAMPPSDGFDMPGTDDAVPEVAEGGDDGRPAAMDRENISTAPEELVAEVGDGVGELVIAPPKAGEDAIAEDADEGTTPFFELLDDPVVDDAEEERDVLPGAGEMEGEEADPGEAEGAPARAGNADLVSGDGGSAAGGGFIDDIVRVIVGTVGKLPGGPLF